MAAPEGNVTRRGLIGRAADAAAAATPRRIPRGTTLWRDDFAPIAGWRRLGVVMRQDLPWESSLLQDPCLVVGEAEGPAFKLWYGSLTTIGYATSDDGVRWTKHPDPVIHQTLPSEAKALNQPSVVHRDGVWHMTYFGVDGGGAGQIHYASAVRPEGPWTKRGVVLTSTAPWEDRYIYNSSLLHDAEERVWKLWYTAGKIASAGGEPRYICYATAPAAAGPWTKHPANPILRPMDDGGWISLGVGGPNVRKLGPRRYEIRLIGWQADYPSRGGRLLSRDGIAWSLDRSAMDLDLGVVGGPEDAMIYRQFVVEQGGRTLCYYNVKNNRPGWNETINLASWEPALDIVDPSKWAMLHGDGIPDGASFAVRDRAVHSLGNAGKRAQTLQGNRLVERSDYGVRATVTPGAAPADRANVIMLRYTDRQNYYYAGIGAGGHRHAIGIVEKGQHRLLAGTGTDSELGAGQPHALTFRARGGLLELFDDGRVVLSVVDPSLTPSSSYVGLQTDDGAGRASFAGVEVFAG